MKIKTLRIILCLCLLCTVLSGRAEKPDAATPDTSRLQTAPCQNPTSQQTDTSATANSTEHLKHTHGDTSSFKKNMNNLVRLFYDAVSRTPRNKEAEQLAAKREREYFDQYSGRKIDKIHIIRQNVFDDNDKHRITKTLNKVHRITQEQKIRRDIFIKPGDTFDPSAVINNRQLLRSRSYLEEADIKVLPHQEDSTIVDLVLMTRDRWSISVDLNAQGNGNTFFEVYDDNILGWGNRFSLKTYFNYRNWNYGGNWGTYETQNILGSFVSGRLVAGKGFNQYSYGGEVHKPFITPTDYSIGSYYYHRGDPVYITPMDSTLDVTYNKWGGWIGKSYQIPKLRNSIFLTMHYYATKFQERPIISDTLHPAFHNEHTLLGSVGFYREEFRTSSLIYGYGVDEDIAYGYKASIYGGPVWSEFGNRWYVGASFNAGHFTSIGYVHWNVAVGSSLNVYDSRLYRSSLITNLNWFSNLLGNGRYRVRQFIDLNYTRGWNRLDGYHEYVNFGSPYEIRSLTEKKLFGENRLVINSETVVFTPWLLRGFRFAIYGFADMGLLGNDPKLFQNPFYSTFGIGVRIKNEKLIFRTINIRLGIGIGGKGWLRTKFFHISTEDRRQSIRYLPQKAFATDLNDNINTLNAWE